jgi:hypothetical protein
MERLVLLVKLMAVMEESSLKKGTARNGEQKYMLQEGIP